MATTTPIVAAAALEILDGLIAFKRAYRMGDRTNPSAHLERTFRGLDAAGKRAVLRIVDAHDVVIDGRAPAKRTRVPGIDRVAFYVSRRAESF